MPTRKKTLHFVSSGLVTSISVGLLGFSMSTQWSETTVECARSGTDNFNGTAVITLMLFNGTMDRTFCPTFGGSAHFPVISKLAEAGVTPLALHALALCLLVLCLVSSACSILISLYNSVSNPYQTYMGPIGIYVCSSICACLSFLTLIIFVVNVNVTSMAEDLVKLYADNIPVDLRNKSAEMRLGYYLVIPYTVLSLVAIALIYMYDHAAYTQRKEQQRPTEDAPKEIMMY